MLLLKLINGIDLPKDIINYISKYLGYVNNKEHGYLRMCNIERLFSDYEGIIISKIAYSINIIKENYFVINLKNISKKIILFNLLKNYKTIIIDRFNLLSKEKTMINIMNDKTVHTPFGIYAHNN